MTTVHCAVIWCGWNEVGECCNPYGIFVSNRGKCNQVTTEAEDVQYTIEERQYPKTLEDK